MSAPGLQSCEPTLHPKVETQPGLTHRCAGVSEPLCASMEGHRLDAYGEHMCPTSPCSTPSPVFAACQPGCTVYKPTDPSQHHPPGGPILTSHTQALCPALHSGLCLCPASLSLIPDTVRHWLEPREVHNGFDEDGVITYIGVLGLHLGDRAEEWTAAGNVHVTDRPLEG